jgi:hypothetical protein
MAPEKPQNPDLLIEEQLKNKIFFGKLKERIAFEIAFIKAPTSEDDDLFQEIFVRIMKAKSFAEIVQICRTEHLADAEELNDIKYNFFYSYLSKLNSN